MNANINTLKQALELTCKAHRGAELRYYEDEGQFGIMDFAVPILTDTKTICKAFFGDSNVVKPDASWGIITIDLYGAEFLPEVDVETLDMALPYGWIEKIVD